MSEKTAHKYRKSGKLPSQGKVIHDWRNSPDPFDPEAWYWVEEVLENFDSIEVKTLFELLQKEHPGKCRHRLNPVATRTSASLNAGANEDFDHAVNVTLSLIIRSQGS